MANMERGAYEPRVHDISAYGADMGVDDGEESSRLPLLIVIALLVLAAFSGVVWLAYTQGVERGRMDTPRVAAAPSAGKASESPLTGLQIYQHAAHGSLASFAPALRATASATEPPPSAEPAPAPVPNPVTPNPVTPKVAALAPAAPKAVTHVVPQLPATPNRLPAAPPKQSAPAVESASANATQPSGISGVLLQIGSYKSDAEARASWVGFKKRHPLAADYQYNVKEVDLGAKGVWYRLRIGTFADKQSAAAVCGKLKQDGASCLIAK